MDIALVVLGGLLIFLGLIGCFLPVLPGPPLGFAGLLLLHLTDYEEFKLEFLLIIGGIVLLVSLVDYLVPIWGTKKFGGSRLGVLGSIVGLLVGIFLFPPFGIILGPFLGAVAGELLNGDDLSKAIKSGFGSFLGYIFGTGIKLAVTVVMGYYFVTAFIK